MWLCFVLVALMLGMLCPPDAAQQQDARGAWCPAPGEGLTRARPQAPADAGDPGAAPTPLAPLPKDVLLRAAYLDAYDILSRDDSCSDFFGGRALSLTVLNRMVTSVRKAALGDEEVGMRMSGEVTYVKDTKSGAQYRLFERMTLNTQGVFYRGQLLRPPRLVADADILPPRARETRVALLLHELAHLLEGKDGRWLILDDGHDRRLSERNTLAVMHRCGRQIRALRDAKAGVAGK